MRLVQVHVVGAQPPSEPLMDSRMCLRERPRSLGPGPVGQYTLVKTSSALPALTWSASPSTSSAPVPA